MTRSIGPMWCSRWCATFFAFTLLALTSAGPLGPHPDDTSTATPPETCTVGNSTYAVGAVVPAGLCERCSCAAGGVTCEREVCQPRPGCKAVHRPDHCCPTYQCECEQEGRVYGNGEKLVDPQDPCRVCYCQGGEVVCRRIACFLRDDCKPRLVPGRCCPEYDNCPLRGVTAVPGVAPSNVLPLDTTTAAPSPPPEKVKQEITIKEITPVSEIPVITDVKIKEIPPPPAVEVIEYPSSKAPLTPREATSERTFSEEPASATDIDNYPSPSSVHVFTASQGPTSSTDFSKTKTNEESSPSKISFSKQDSINSDIYPSSASSSGQTTLSQPSTVITNKPQVIEEEDQTIFEHNPAFPPLPDDLSVLSNHEDEIMPEQPMETDHSEPSTHPEPAATTTTSTPAPTTVMSTTPPSTTTTTRPPPTEASTTTERITTMNPTTVGSDNVVTSNVGTTTVEKIKVKKVSPLLNLRSAIPTAILSIPSSVPEVITGEIDEEEVTSTTRDVTTTDTPTTTIGSTAAPTHAPITSKPITVTPLATPAPHSEPTTVAQEGTTLLHLTTRDSPLIATSSAVTHSAKSASAASSDQTTEKDVVTTFKSQESTTVYSTKTNDVTTKTEFSSLPVETSDQNPPSSVSGGSDSTDKERTSTSEPLTAPTSIKIIATEAEPITVSRSSNTEQLGNDNYETTEFILTSFGSSETTTDPVELLKISSDADKKAAIIDPGSKNKMNVLTDLINLVGDVASISNNSETDRPHPSAVPIPSIPDSEELIPVNAGYKSNKNKFNVNSITEVPLKTKNPAVPGRQKIIEIEEENTDLLTDLPPPGDRVEPTTRRPIIDHVTDDGASPTATDKDIEIITKSYVPTINRRPTKVVMKEEEPAAGLVPDPPAEAR